MSAGSQGKDSVNERIPYDDPDLLDQLNKAVGGCCVFTLRYPFYLRLPLVNCVSDAVDETGMLWSFATNARVYPIP